MDKNIEWQTEDVWQYAIIGLSEGEYVMAIIAVGNNTLHHWNVCISKTPEFDVPMGWLVAVGDTYDLEQAKRDAEYYGKEWIKGDSPIWAE